MTLLRPEWLLALPLVIWFLRSQGHASRVRWQDHIDPHLLQPLMQPQNDRRARWLRRVAAFALIMLPIALAGPAIEQSTDTALTERPMVIVLDQTPSMLSEDISPDRHTRARQKIQDWLRANPERPAALVAYSGTAHLAAPVTFDHSALTTILLQLSPQIMPMPGSHPTAAMELALEQLQERPGDILWLTDDLTAEQRVNMPEFTHAGQQLGIITVGTESGAPVRLSEDSYLTDNSGNLVQPGLDTTEINILSDHSAIRWQPMSLDDTDWQRVLPAQATGTGAGPGEERTITRDLGPWLLLVLIPGLVLLYRRGHMMAVLLAAGITLQLPAPAVASPADWFRSPDQQGYARLPDDPGTAMTLFRSLDWQVYAALEAEQYGRALELLGDDDSAISLYHRGNALVHMERYEEALAAYESALERQPEFPEAEQNRDLVQAFLDQPPPEGSDDDEDPSPRDDGLPGGSEPRGDGPTTMGEPDPDAGAASQGGEDQEAQATEDSIRQRLPEPDASFLERKFEFQYQADPDLYDDTGPAW